MAGENEEPITMIVGKSYFQLDTFGNRDNFLHLKSLLDGRNSVDQICEKTGIDPGNVNSILSTFSEIGILRQETPTSFVKSSDFIEKITDSCDMWQKQIGFHKLFDDLENSRLRKEVFIGWLIETYHYVKSAPVHTSFAIANCKNNFWRDILTGYFIDEHTHWKLYEDSLCEMGVNRTSLQNAHPLIGTMSLINMLCDIASKDTLAYFACTGLFEAKKADFNAAEKNFLKIAQLYGFEGCTVSPIIDHMRQDVMANHTSLLSEALEGINEIEALDAHYAVNCVHDLKHAFDQFHDQVISYYSDISNYIPRLKVDYFSL
ncbi:MAG: hypothetical protein JWQ66_1632 [Mucilaginibacter sp.]|nr:hypothetical protein [Mucilaginibacter sp.]